MKTLAEDVRGSVAKAHHMWGWYLAMGIAMIAAGAYCIYAENIATLASVVTIGVVLFIAGAFQVAGAFMAKGASDVILLLLVGLLDGIAGVILVQHPDIGALTLTLVLGSVFIFGGVYRFIAALSLQFPNYGWAAVSALISVALGVMLWMQWPSSAVWFIGFAVGVNLIMAGISWCAIALRLKDAPTI